MGKPPFWCKPKALFMACVQFLGFISKMPAHESSLSTKNTSPVAFCFALKSKSTCTLNLDISAFEKRCLKSEIVLALAAFASLNALGDFDQPIKKPNYICLISCSFYNSWHNLKKEENSHCLILTVLRLS